MKRFAIFSLYWATCLLLLAAVICSMGYRMPEALMLSTSLLPVAIIFRQMTSRISFSNNRREAVKSLVFILLFVLTMALLAVHIAQSIILYDYRHLSDVEFVVPPMLLNPIFLLSILTLMIIGDYGLRRMLVKRLPEAEEKITFASDLQSATSAVREGEPKETNEPITFVSNRQSVTLPMNEILYIESCDTEVWVHATDDRRFRNKTPISSWSRLLGPEYIRTHRSYLVRLSACTSLDHDNVVLGDVRLPISRKYKEQVVGQLSTPN